MSKAKEVRSKIKLVCCSRKKGYPGWPHIDFDHEGLMERYERQLSESLPNCDFTVAFYTSPDEAIAGFADNNEYDGVVLFNATHGVGVANEFLKLGQPGVIVDELYAGSGDLIRFNTRIKKDNLPIAVVASSDFNDVVRAVRLIHVKKQLENAKIVLFKNFEPLSDKTEAFLKEALGTGSTWKRYLAGPDGLKDKLDKLKKNFGVEVVLKTKADLEKLLDEAPLDEAEKLADEWIKGAEKVVEPSRDDVVQSAKMYLGLKKCVDEEQADAVSVDCIMMFYTTELSVYPCMSHSKMLDEGLIGTCESDIDSTLTQLLVKFMTGQASFVSDPVIDTASNQIIYAHCAAATRWYGDNSPKQPYFLRSHAEDHNSTSIQSIMPVNETVTTVKIDIANHAMALHTGKAVGNVTEEKGCRTKLAAEVTDAQRLLDNWDSDIFSWHKVTFYGDYRRDLLNFSRMYGLSVVQEDVDIPKINY
ncbi:MAG: hypothetical protein HUJ73_00435 [Eubacterium sp.]|nr:hypothetical protein [Eubacterium sp.]